MKSRRLPGANCLLGKRYGRRFLYCRVNIARARQMAVRTSFGQSAGGVYEPRDDDEDSGAMTVMTTVMMKRYAGTTATMATCSPRINSCWTCRWQIS